MRFNKLMRFALLSLAALAMAVGQVGAASNLKGKISLVGSTSVQPLAEELARAYMKLHPQVQITVAGGGSGAGIKAIQAGQAEIGTSSRSLNPEEKAGLTATEIARDGIAVIINPKNTVSGLRLSQIAAIYQGKSKNWQDVGGTKAPVVLIGREAGSGTRGAFEELVLGKVLPSPSMLVQGSTGAVRQTVASNKNAIGYISLGQLDKSIKAIKVEGVIASEANVLNGTYKLSRPFLFLTKGKVNSVTRSFLDFVLSAPGQALVGKEFVPVGSK
jgi:phosphate transport system substrate-binding protein